MARWKYSFVSTLHYLIIIIMLTYMRVLNFWNACPVILSSVCLSLGQFSQSSFMQYMGLRVLIQLTDLSYDAFDNISTLYFDYH